LLVFVHELGHFLVARKMGVKAEEFGFGFPPRMIGVYKAQNGRWRLAGRKTPVAVSTIYSVNWLPLGGFVKIKGEEGGDKEDEDSFAHKKIWQKVCILAAGVTMNMILAAALLSWGFGIGIPQVIEGDMSGANIKSRATQIVSVGKDSPAELAGIVRGDELASVDGQTFSFADLQNYLTGKIGKEVVYKIKRNNEILEKKITPGLLPETGKGGIGIGLVDVGVVSYPWHLAIWKGIGAVFFMLQDIVLSFGIFFKSLFGGSGAAVDLSGPVGIAVLTNRAAKLGLPYLIQFAAALSVNLAVINILPFPALDGGRILFLAIEKIRRKPVSQKVENTIHNIGFALLMILIVSITIGDVSKYGGKFAALWRAIMPK
jgi:regulator of sigma E protease